MSNYGFGVSTKISDKYLFVGDCSFDSNKGRAFAYKKEGDLLGAPVILSFPGEADAASPYFGYWIDYQNGYLAIGAYRGFDGKGGVYIYREIGDNQWSDPFPITSPKDIVNAYMGRRFCITGDYISIGAYGEDQCEVFKKTGDNTWEYVCILEHGESGNFAFGNCSAIDGKNVYIGSQKENKVYKYQLRI